MSEENTYEAAVAYTALDLKGEFIKFKDMKVSASGSGELIIKDCVTNNVIDYASVTTTAAINIAGNKAFSTAFILSREWIDILNPLLNMKSVKAERGDDMAIVPVSIVGNMRKCRIGTVQFIYKPCDGTVYSLASDRNYILDAIWRICESIQNPDSEAIRNIDIAKAVTELLLVRDETEYKSQFVVRYNTLEFNSGGDLITVNTEDYPFYAVSIENMVKNAGYCIVHDDKAVDNLAIVDSTEYVGFDNVAVAKMFSVGTTNVYRLVNYICGTSHKCVFAVCSTHKLVVYHENDSEVVLSAIKSIGRKNL